MSPMRTVCRPLVALLLVMGVLGGTERAYTLSVRPAAPEDCRTGLVWEGLPNLNRFTYYTVAQGNTCTVFHHLIKPNAFATLTIPPGATYTMEDNVTVSGTLTIAAGGTLSPRGGLLAVSTLNEVGTPGRRATIAGTNYGISLASGGNNTLRDATLSGAVGFNRGYASSPTLSLVGAHLTVSQATIQNGICSSIDVGRGGVLALSDSVISGTASAYCGAGNGVEVATGGLATLVRDTFVGNAGWPVLYDSPPRNLTLVNNGLRASGNNTHLAPQDGNVIEVAAGSPISGAWTLATPGLPVRFEGNVGVARGARLAVGAGTHLLFNTNLGPQGSYSLYIAGALTMNGTATRPISLTTVDPTGNAHWGGINFTPGSHGRLNDVHLSYAGVSNVYIRPAILVDGASPTIANSTVDTSTRSDVEVAHGGRPLLRHDSWGALGSNVYGVVNDSGASGPAVDATSDWWGDPSGPSGAARGKGVPVSAGVRFSPWLRTPPTPEQVGAAR